MGNLQLPNDFKIRYIPSMLSFVLKRLLMIIPTAFGVVTLTFLLIHLVPGDPVEVLLGEHAMPADREALREALGLHLPVWEQYVQFVMNLFQGNLGESYYKGVAVTELILNRLPATGELALAAISFALLIAIPLGVWSAANRGGVSDKASNVLTLAGLAMPSFWLGPLLIIVFSLWLGWLPVSGREGGIPSLVLPAITLGLGMAAMTTRLLRSTLLDVLGSDFIRTATAKGCARKTILYRHALSNALLPVITVVFLQAGALLTGAILTETVFSWPGLGTLIVDALNQRDYPVVQGCVLFIALVYMLMTFLSDLVYGLVDPRIRVGGRHDS